MPLLPDWDHQAFYFSAGYLLELELPAFTRPGDEQQDQAIPGLTESIVCRVFHTPETYQRRELGN